MEALLRDIKYGVRLLLQNPGVTAIAVLSLALGIGANTAMFSWANALILTPVRVAEPDSLVRVYTTHPGGFDEGSLSWPDFQDLRQTNDVFTDMAAFAPGFVSFTEGDATERIGASLVSGNYFEFLRVEPGSGRWFRADEDEVPGRDAVAVISNGFWKRRYASDPGVVGRAMTLNGHPFTVVGVAPEGFRLAAIDLAVDVWVPSMMQQQIQPGSNLLESRGNRSVQGLGRLGPGTTLETAQANTSAVAAQLAVEYPDSNGEQGSMLIPLKVSLFPQSARAAVSAMVWILMGVVGLVLLIACANVANLLLARAAARSREVSVRLALGAGRGRLVRQLLTESMLLAILAGGFGVVVAIWTNRLIVSLQPPLPIPIDIDVGIDPIVLAFTAVAALLTGVLFGLAPAVQATRPDLVAALKGAALQGGGRSWLKNTLVVSQIALSMVLLIGAGLFLRSLQNAQSIDPGFDASNMLVAALDPGLQGYDEVQSDDFYSQLMERVGALPGVRSASIGLSVPLTFGGSRQWGFSVDGYEFAPNERDNVDYNVVGPGYFRTMRIPIVAGREFTDADVEDAQPAIVINETFARRFFANRDPIGGIVNTMRGERIVVGVAQDSKYYTIGEDPLPFVYGPYRQVSMTQFALHVRTDSDPLAILASVRAETRNLDAAMPLFEAGTMSDHVGNALLLQRLTTGVFATFGSLALLLAAVGLYGVMAFAVAQRTREIGIRVALGADGADVRGLVMKKSMSLALIGLAIGLALGLGLAVLIAGALYDVSPFDPLALGGSTLTILAVAFVASYLPALRATRIDPMVALRN